MQIVGSASQVEIKGKRGGVAHLHNLMGVLAK